MKRHSADSEQNPEPQLSDIVQPGALHPFPLRRPAAVAVRLLGFTLLWWAISEGRWEEPLLILVIIFIATFYSLRLWPPGAWRWRPLRLGTFLPYFFWQSLCGGFDVARRAFQLKPSLSPEIIEIKVDLPAESACLFAWVVSLLPGTACIHKDGTTFQIHLLDADSRAKVQNLEERMQLLLHNG